VSHELRTPLTALRAVGEVALRGSHDAEGYRDVIGSMLEEVDRLTRLTDELLILARADAGEAKLHLEPVDLGALAREVAGHLEVLAEEKEQRLVYRVDKSRSREMGGTGLGLALVKWAAEAHGGRVELETEVGRGSTFRIVLPSAPPANGHWRPAPTGGSPALQRRAPTSEPGAQPFAW
jgi:signal transduction histidine kinase